MIKVVEDGTGRLLGTVDPGAAHSTVHRGAVYVHQGSTYLVDQLSLEDQVALVHRESVDYTTTARDITNITISEVTAHESWGDADLYFGTVDVSSQVVAFLKRRYLTGEVLGEEPLDLPPRNLHTTAVWWTINQDLGFGGGLRTGGEGRLLKISQLRGCCGLLGIQRRELL